MTKTRDFIMDRLAQELAQIAALANDTADRRNNGRVVRTK